MPTINVEMMQQLLQEFTEKEALSAEEIKLIEQQILELETRITICRDRLKNLNEDKDRLDSMMSRYVGGKSALPNHPVSPNTGSKMPRLADNTSKPVVFNPQTAPSETTKNSVIEDLQPTTSDESNPDDSENRPAANSDDAIKSINDALKGLFRK